MTPLAEGDSGNAAKPKLFFVGFPPKMDVAIVVHKPSGELPARRGEG